MSFDFNKELRQGAEKLSLQISDGAYTSLELYFQELRKWNRKVNLIAKATTDVEIVEKHFLDSLTLTPIILNGSAHLLDIGTGAGFPGLVCKVALGERLRLTLVEPRLKRVSFLKHIVRTLKLDGVTVYPKRLEEIPGLTGDNFSHITCRAVTEIAPFLEMVAPFSKSGTQLLCMKGPRWQEELDQATDAMRKSGFKAGRIMEHVLPISGAQRAILFFEV